MTLQNVKCGDMVTKVEPSGHTTQLKALITTNNTIFASDELCYSKMTGYRVGHIAPKTVGRLIASKKGKS